MWILTYMLIFVILIMLKMPYRCSSKYLWFFEDHFHLFFFFFGIKELKLLQEEKKHAHKQIVRPHWALFCCHTSHFNQENTSSPATSHSRIYSPEASLNISPRLTLFFHIYSVKLAFFILKMVFRYHHFFREH